MTNKLPVPFDGYRVERTMRLDHRVWNAVLPDLDLRVRALEDIRDRETDLFNKGVGEVIKRIDIAIAPVIEQVKADAEAASEQLEEILETGIPAGRIQETPERVFVNPTQKAAIDAMPGQIAAAIAASNRVSARAYILSGF